MTEAILLPLLSFRDLIITAQVNKASHAFFDPKTESHINYVHLCLSILVTPDRAQVSASLQSAFTWARLMQTVFEESRKPKPVGENQFIRQDLFKAELEHIAYAGTNSSLWISEHYFFFKHTQPGRLFPEKNVLSLNLVQWLCPWALFQSIEPESEFDLYLYHKRGFNCMMPDCKVNVYCVRTGTVIFQNP